MRSHETGGSGPTFHEVLHGLRVWDTELPSFDPGAAPASPLPLFHAWFVAAAAAGQPEPHTMTLATVDSQGRPDLRTLMLHDADARGWHFASHATSAKGRQLAARPEAALHFYWPAQGRQVRLRGAVHACDRQESRATLTVRGTGALAAALTGHQSEALGSVAELAQAADAAWARAERDPQAPVPSWVRYVLDPREVEFFQGDARRRHVRLRYHRQDGAGQGPDGGPAAGGDGEPVWLRELLWP
ncbi:pyridoxal 5'-phosphate synthase [Streptomyces sp. NPDC006879]|uniref:pyridoxine/pyridoxamine 5'-phosphate oxidase n=1 Tax=Streptomyces sp. NPDC006879 TaxID=3364767 RepID=UPI00369FAA88